MSESGDDATENKKSSSGKRVEGKKKSTEITFSTYTKKQQSKKGKKPKKKVQLFESDECESDDQTSNVKKQKTDRPITPTIEESNSIASMSDETTSLTDLLKSNEKESTKLVVAGEKRAKSGNRPVIGLDTRNENSKGNRESIKEVCIWISLSVMLHHYDHRSSIKINLNSFLKRPHNWTQTEVYQLEVIC